MPFFTKKSDPAEKSQRDLETKLKAKRASRDDLVERRKLAEAGAAAHREKAIKLASDGADETALSAAETAMRREQDRVATLSDAITIFDVAIAGLEKEIAQVVDQRCRAETAAAISTLVDKWGSAQEAFQTAVSELADLARESAVITLGAYPLQIFLNAVKQQVAPETDLVAGLLRDHAKAVLAGTAPASLPKSAEPVAIEQPASSTPEPHFSYQPLKHAPRFRGAPARSAKVDPALAAAGFSVIDRSSEEREITFAVPRF
jgi:hypothetical protein